MTIVFQKSLLKSKHAKRIVADAKLTYFKEKVLAHLDRLEEKERKMAQAVQKALVEAECLRKAAYPVGTIREWKGKKYIKTAPGKWRRKYDKESKGASRAIAALKKKVDACKSSEELLQLVLEHSDRFRDNSGRPLPFVQELSEYVSKANDEIVAGKRGTYGHAAKLRNEFNARTNPLIGKTFKSKDGHTVEFTQDSQDKIRSSTQKTQENGFTVEEHFEAANQIKHLFESASLVKWHADKRGDKNLKIGRFLSGEITLNSGKKAKVCITVKHILDKNKKAIYSIEGMEITDALAKTRAKGYGRHLEGTSSPLGNVSQNGNAVKQKKKDILGNVSEDSLKKKGISGNAARLIMSLYDAAGDAPLQDTPEARRAYAKGLSALRDKLEGAKTDADVEDALRDIGDDLSLFSYRMKLRPTEEYKKRRAAWENAEQKSSESFNRLQELARKKDKESRAAERRVYKQVKEYLVENGAMYEFEGIKDEYDRERYAGRLPSGKKGEYDKFFDGIYKKEEAKLNEKLAKLNAEVKAENAAYKEAKEKASKARADFEKWEDGQTRAMANADPLYEGWVQLGKDFRDAVERERANLIPGF